MAAKTKQLDLNGNFDELEEIIKQMQDPNISLDESFDRYKEGLKLVKECWKKIDTVEKELKVLKEEDDD